MKEIKIEEIEKEGYYEYHIASDSRGFLDYTTQTNVALDLLYDGSGLSMEDVYAAYNIERLHFSDNYLLYYWIIKAFLNQSENYLICFDTKEEVSENLGDEIRSCQWKYQFEYLNSSYGISYTDWGFLKPAQFLQAANYSNKEVGNRGYHLKKITPSQILHSFNLMRSDVTGWNFVSFPQKEESKLLTMLQDEKRPDILDVLGEQNIIVALQFGVDEGYCDYILIKSSKRLQREVYIIEKDINERGNIYENRLKEVYYWEFYPYLVNELFDLPLIKK